MRDLDKLAAKARDMIRVDYECARGCDTRYPEHVVKREREPCCGRCGGPLVRLTMVVVDRDD
jgi:rRNA maturation endonuclease Nob1